MASQITELIYITILSIYFKNSSVVQEFVRLNAYLESGDSSVGTRWTVDQEVVGSNPTHGGNLISVVRSPSEFTQPIR